MDSIKEFKRVEEAAIRKALKEAETRRKVKQVPLVSLLERDSKLSCKN